MGQYHVSNLLYFSSQLSVEHENISCQNNFHYITNDSRSFDVSENYFFPFDLYNNLSSSSFKNGIDIKMGTNN